MHVLQKPRCRRRAAFSILEVAVTLTIVTVSLAMFAQTMASSKKLDPIASETAVAASSARTVLEEMKNQDFKKLFALYNADPTDDPSGPGTAPGATFAVPELTPLVPGGRAGTISFPVANGRLREDVVDGPLGMPRDLDADGNVDGTDHANDYVLLPIRIRIDWIAKGTKSMQRKFEIFTMYTSFRP
jgi:type II secretory pathway pseudopilin PulG